MPPSWTPQPDAPGTSSRLFAYGTLALPSVIAALLGRRLRGRGATLSGFARHGVRAQVFPAIVAESGAQTVGVVYSRLTARDWARLDAFESAFFERRRVCVDVGARGTLSACAYVVADRFRGKLTAAAWDAAHFRRHHLREYLRAMHSPA